MATKVLNKKNCQNGYCFNVKNINELERCISTIKMEHFRKSDIYSVYFNGKTVLAQDAEDLFGENSMSLVPQQTIDLCANPLEVPTTDPQEGPSCEKIRINCEFKQKTVLQLRSIIGGFFQNITNLKPTCVM